MIWIYQRGADDLRIETTYDNATKEYVITINHPHETAVERFKSAAAFRVRLNSLEAKIQIERWHRVCDPIVLREGWRVG